MIVSVLEGHLTIASSSNGICVRYDWYHIAGHTDLLKTAEFLVFYTCIQV